MPQVTVRAPVHPSEDEAKVKKAVLNVFPGANFEVRAGVAVAKTDSLTELRGLIRKQKILDAGRRSLLRSLDESGTTSVFRLNKQAAYSGRVSFSEDIQSPLGDLVVTVEGEGLEDLFKEMAPMTIRGIPVSEEQAEQEIAKRKLRKKTPTPEVDWDQEIEAVHGEGVIPDEPEVEKE